MIAALLLLLAQVNPEAAQFQSAQKLASEGKCADAIPVLRQLGARHPDTAPITFALGRCYFEQKNYQAAEAALKLAAMSEPREAPVRYFLGIALGMGGKTPEGIEQLRLATELDPAFAPAWRVLGMFRLESGQTGPETQQALENAVRLDPGDARAPYWLGRFWLERKKYEAARLAFEKALELDGGAAQAHLGHAQAVAALGSTAQALAEFDTVLKTQPDSAGALLGRARCLYASQQFEPALAAALAAESHASTPDERRASAWLLGRLYRILDRAAEAAAMERKLAGIEAEFLASLARFRQLQEQAMRFKAEGNTAKVIETLEAALAIQERQDSLVLLGDSYAETGKLAEAERCYLRAGQAGPETAEIQARLRALREKRAASTQ
ncbi:MAG TPA: tetratricopeptide repeat protein [Bryobacteraceae bacterium]|nr:tetratricopeptide repeat protein [Bryobacteraceae bacterium]